MMINDKPMRVRQKALVRFVPRALRSLSRHADDPGLAALRDRLQPEAQSFDEALAQRRAAAAAVTRSTAESKHLLDALRAELSMWMGMSKLDAPAFDSSAYQGREGTPDELFAASSAFTALMANWTGSERPDYTDVAIEALQAAQAAAQERWLSRQAEIVALQEAQAMARETARTVHARLVEVRRALRQKLGRRHRDYTRLTQSAGAQSEASEVEAPAGTSQALELSPSNDAQHSAASDADEVAQAADFAADLEAAATAEETAA